jgi:SprT protein
MQEDRSIKVLQRYLPSGTENWVWHFIQQHKVSFRISKRRRSKLGDFRPAQRNQPHRISVNGDLSEYHFFLTTLHEFAHLLTWETFRNKVSPHGDEWKTQYRNLVKPFLQNGVFPNQLKPLIQEHLVNLKSSSCADPNLYKALSSYENSGTIYLEDLQIGEQFSIENGFVFTKGEKLRTYYKCTRSDGKVYRVSGVAAVKPIHS